MRQLSKALFQVGANKFEIQSIVAFPQIAAVAVDAVRAALKAKESEAKKRLAQDGIKKPTDKQVYEMLMRICNETH